MNLTQKETFQDIYILHVHRQLGNGERMHELESDAYTDTYILLWTINTHMVTIDIYAFYGNADYSKIDWYHNGFPKRYWHFVLIFFFLCGTYQSVYTTYVLSAKLLLLLLLLSIIFHHIIVDRLRYFQLRWLSYYISQCSNLHSEEKCNEHETPSQVSIIEIWTCTNKSVLFMNIIGKISLKTHRYSILAAVLIWNISRAIEIYDFHLVLWTLNRRIEISTPVSPNIYRTKSGAIAHRILNGIASTT